MTPIVAVDAQGLERAAAAISAGEPIVVPTDTVYGLAVRAGDPRALDRLFELKRRPSDRSIAVLVVDIDQAMQLASFSAAALAAANEHWPGQLTLVVDRHEHVDSSVGRHDGTVGIRCPAHSFIRDLAGLVGPLSTTSANLSGEATPATASAAAAALDGAVALVVDDGPCESEASTVARIDADGSTIIFRQGPVHP